MKRQLLSIANVLLAATAVYAADATRETTIDTAAAFGRLKSLAGTWEADSQMGKLRVSYELIAGGTALVERESGEKMPTMVTVYHLDGNRLLLTHYCMAGNQPRMQATAFDPSARLLEFRFLDATNLATPETGHMHNVSFRFVDDTHFTSAWQFYENGRLKMTESAEYTRAR